MNLRIVLCTLALAPLSLFADEKSHRQAAARVVELTRGEQNLEATLPNIVEPTLAQMRRQGVPADIIEDVKATVGAWFRKEVKWADIEPTMLKIWTNNYSEEELKMIANFFQSPGGKKFLERQPQVMMESSALVQEYLKTKQGALQAALAPIAERARKAVGNGAGGGAAPAPSGKKK